jgi:hypothetical protein
MDRRRKKIAIWKALFLPFGLLAIIGLTAGVAILGRPGSIWNRAGIIADFVICCLVLYCGPSISDFLPNAKIGRLPSNPDTKRDPDAP